MGISNLCLDVVFFMTRFRVAELHGKVVMVTNLVKQRFLVDRLADMPADTCCIVEDHHGRYTADIGKEVLEYLTDIFNGFSAKYLCKAFIAVGE